MRRMISLSQLFRIIDNKLIIKSPDGSEWRITVDNAGVVKAEKVVK